MRFIVLIALISVGLAGPALAQDNPAAGVTVNSVQETVKKSPQISGAVVVGLVAGGPESKTRPSLSAWLPSSWQGRKACVRLRSEDGLYDGNINMTVAAGWKGGIASISLKQSQHLALLRTLPPGAVAAYVRLGTCGQETRDPGTIAFWSVDPSGKGPLQLMVNSFHADEVFVTPSNAGSGKPVKCHPAKGEMVSAYDTVCDIKRDWLTPEGTELLIYRMRRQAFDPPVSVKFVGSAGQ